MLGQLSAASPHIGCFFDHAVWLTAGGRRKAEASLWQWALLPMSPPPHRRARRAPGLLSPCAPACGQLSHGASGRDSSS